MKELKLAINGGSKIRDEPLPYRNLFNKEKLDFITKVFHDSWKEEKDFSYEGKYEKLYTDKFCKLQGGGFADGVSSGTAGIYVSLQALGLKPKSDVIVSPVTDPGSVSPVIISQMNPIIADSAPDSFNIGPDQFKEAITPNTRAAILTHLGGTPFDIEPIIEIARENDIKIIEDCSQAHGALYKGKRVGCFGDIAVFSTMFSKNHSTGGCGGIVYTQNEDYYWLVRSYADRGKPFRYPDFNQKDPSTFLFPALNFNLDELSCALGISTLDQLLFTISRRVEIIEKINKKLQSSNIVIPHSLPKYIMPSPYFMTVHIDVNKINVPKLYFAQAVATEGILINPDYRYVVSEWNWITNYLKTKAKTPNATKFRNESFNILLHERFTDTDSKDIVDSILKVERVLGDSSK